MMPNTTWRVTNAYGSSTMRVRDAEYTMKQPDDRQRRLRDQQHPVDVADSGRRARADVAEAAVGPALRGTSAPCGVTSHVPVVRSVHSMVPIPPNRAVVARVSASYRRRGDAGVEVERVGLHDGVDRRDPRQREERALDDRGGGLRAVAGLLEVGGHDVRAASRRG